MKTPEKFAKGWDPGGAMADSTGFLRFGLRPPLRKPVDIGPGKLIKLCRFSHSEWTINRKGGRVFLLGESEVKSFLKEKRQKKDDPDAGRSTRTRKNK